MYDVEDVSTCTGQWSKPSVWDMLAKGARDENSYQFLITTVNDTCLTRHAHNLILP